MAANQVKAEPGIGVEVACAGLALVGAYMWVLFAQTFASSMSTTCGENCVAQADPGVSLGIYLGMAVGSTVFSAALLVVALLRRSA